MIADLRDQTAQLRSEVRAHRAGAEQVDEIVTERDRGNEAGRGERLIEDVLGGEVAVECSELLFDRRHRIVKRLARSEPVTLYRRDVHVARDLRIPQRSGYRAQDRLVEGALPVDGMPQ